MKFDITNNQEQIANLHALKVKAVKYCKEDGFDIDVAIKMYDMTYKMYKLNVSSDEEEMHDMNMDVSDICISIAKLYLQKGDASSATKWYKIAKTDI